MASKKTIKKVEAPIDQHETFVSLQKSFADSDLSVEEKLRTLYELQKADSEIDNILQLRGELPREVEALEEEIAQMKVKSAEISALVEQLNRNIADAKLAIADHESTIEKYQRQLEAITNSREYDSLRTRTCSVRSRKRRSRIRKQPSWSTAAAWRKSRTNCPSFPRT